VQGVSYSIPQLGRRQSVQIGASGGVAGGGESPRGSIVEDEKGT